MEDNKTIYRRTSVNSKDMFCWALITIFIMSGVFAGYYFVELDWPIRLVCWIVIVGASAGLAYFTTQGKKFWEFIKLARMELYKVVWPTREETVKTTAIVAVLVFAMSLILWALDTFLLWVVGWFTG